MNTFPGSRKKITVLIADDHTLVRETWAFILNHDGRFQVIAECGTGEEAVKMTGELKPEVVLMDINLPGINGMEATEQIRAISPSTKVLAISLHCQPVYTKQIMKKGAMGYVTKNSSRVEMLEAIIAVYSGNKYICKEIKDTISNQLLAETPGENGLNSLTGREIEIIGFIRRGESSKDIAKSLNIAVKTVEVHRHNILKKLKLKNSSALVNYVSKQVLE